MSPNVSERITSLIASRPAGNRAPGLAVLAFAVLALAACSTSATGGTSSASPTAAAATGGAQGAGSGQGFVGRGGAAASGTIAEITGDTLQVQSTTAQTAVNVTAKTTYTDRATVAASTLKVGDCAVAAAIPPTSTTSSAPPSSASSGAGRVPPTTLAATTVVISAPVNGSCGAGIFGRSGAARPSGAPTGSFPSGSRPSGSDQRGGGFNRFGEVVSGKVTARSGTTITVSDQRRGASGTATTPTVSTITTSATTVFSRTIPATKAFLKVGLCAQAFGTPHSTGAVTATRVSVSPPTGGQCATGFGGGGR